MFLFCFFLSWIKHVVHVAYKQWFNSSNLLGPYEWLQMIICHYQAVRGSLSQRCADYLINFVSVSVWLDCTEEAVVFCRLRRDSVECSSVWSLIEQTWLCWIEQTDLALTSSSMCCPLSRVYLCRFLWLCVWAALLYWERDGKFVRCACEHISVF